MIERWWEYVEPILKGESDGQVSQNVYARYVAEQKEEGVIYSSDDGWEYAVITYDDDGRELGGVLLRNGQVTVVAAE